MKKKINVIIPGTAIIIACMYNVLANAESGNAFDSLTDGSFPQLEANVTMAYLPVHEQDLVRPA